MPTSRNLCFVDPDLLAEMNQQADTFAADPEEILEMFEEQLDDINGERDFNQFLQRAQ